MSDARAELMAEVARAQSDFGRLLDAIEARGGLLRGVYVRFLQTQYHLTRGVQRHFFAVAGHEDLYPHRGLRQWLLDFGREEESHYRIAEADLGELGEGVGDVPLLVRLWWDHFDREVAVRPFCRLGATCILENVSQQHNARVRALIEGAGWLTPTSTRFLVLHQHETVPHGDQVLAAVEAAELPPAAWAQLVEGARRARRIYLGMLADVVVGDGDSLSLLG